MKRLIVFAVLLSASSAWAAATLPTDPTAVSISINPTPVTTTSLITTFVGLQSAIAAADCGTKIVVDHTIDLTGTSKITLPAFAGTCAGASTGATAVSGSSGAHAVSGSSGAAASSGGAGDNYAMITTDGTLPADGTKVTIAGDAAEMPTIRSPLIGSGNYLFDCANGAHHWRIKGIHIKGENGAPGSVGGIGCSGQDTTNAANHPDRISIEQVIIEGDATWGLYSAIDAHATNLQIVDSDLGENVKIADTETHTVLLSGGAGPYKFWNNRCADSAICLFVGDSTVHTVGVIPSDLDIQYNEFLKNTGWDVGTFPGNTAKGHYECKHCKKVRIENNTFRRMPVGAQMQAINLCSVRGNGGTCQDVTFAYNLVDQTPIAMTMTARPTLNTAYYGISGDGTTNCSGGECIKITSPLNCECTTGQVVSLRGVADTTEANTDALITRLTSTTFTIPVPFVNASAFGTISNIVSGCSGACLLITHNGTVATGNTVKIVGVYGTSEANTTAVATVVNATNFTIPVAFVNAYDGAHAPPTFNAGGSITYYYPGAPANRVNIHDNVFSRSGSTTIANSTNWYVFGINAYGVLPAGDDANSSTGSWSFDNLRIVNNTCVDTGTQPNWTRHWISSPGSGYAPGAVPYASYNQGANWEITNNVCQVGRGDAGYRLVEFDAADGTAHSYNTAALDFLSAPGTRTFSKNVFYRPNNAIATEMSTFTSSEAYPANVLVTDETNIGFTNFTGTDPDNFILTNLYTWSNCSASSASTTVTCLGATIPITVMKGTPFKVDSNGTFGIVASRTDSTHVELEANYAATVSGASTFGFKGWGVGGVDPGADTSLVAE